MRMDNDVRFRDNTCDHSVAYTYSVVRYAQDRTSGEALNVGILICASQQGFLKARFISNPQRLAQAFVAFDRENYNKAVHRVELAIERIQITMQPSSSLLSFVTQTTSFTMSEVLDLVFSDNGFSLFHGGIAGGMADDLDEELEYLYSRFVRSHQDDTQRRQGRNDEQVWRTYLETFREYNVSSVFEPKTVYVKGLEYKFDHAFKNGSWHVLQPVTMDYSDKAYIRDRVNKIVGEARVLENRSDIDNLYVLLGKPENPAHLEAYEQAVEILSTDIAIDHRIVEEDKGREFAQWLAAYLEEHARG